MSAALARARALIAMALQRAVMQVQSWLPARVSVIEVCIRARMSGPSEQAAPLMVTASAQVRMLAQLLPARVSANSWVRTAYSSFNNHDAPAIVLIIIRNVS
jgi:hypothetical protein